ncbi:DUF58 domain-containing protein [Paraferrimonas haliotis]|uniref:DUF58 domain-containing protein n=1 Tax=Paraferrimonas haliotis TaxID=2013866 RepID=A0AA37WVX8_9GAMM|nr:DUF58 domain-containing protein [Paraferrimonas haliotis]GLS82622.1 hypothetical protein GCM10007894_05990 [Paraferrimonas haliotis]
MVNQALPIHSNGIDLCDKELVACQSLAKGLPVNRIKSKHLHAGTRSSAIKGRGMEFAEVRLYQAGDDVRSIDWRVTARTGKAHTKLFVEERERPVILLVDLGLCSDFGTSLLLQSVQIAHVAATLGWFAVQQGDKLGGIIAANNGHSELKPKARRSGILALIKAMLQIHRSAEEDHNKRYLEHAVARLRRLAKPGSLVWIVSDGSQLNPSLLRLLNDVKRHCEIGLVHVTDPLRTGDLTMPSHFKLPVNLNGSIVELNQKNYQDYLHLQQQNTTAIATWCQQHNIRYRQVTAAKPLSSQLGALS